MNDKKRNEKIFENLDEKSRFFVIKSFSEEDVHKAMKYNVWASTKTGNTTLDSVYKEVKGQENTQAEVFLFFSCNGSGRFVGVSKMKSAVQLDKYFPYWTQDNKWNCLFDLEWILIKDVPMVEFKDVEFLMRDGEVKPFSNSRDTQEVPFTQGRIILERFGKFSSRYSILEHFENYDLRQQNYEKTIEDSNNGTD